MGNDAAERTEDATPRRRQKERKKGNISKSQDLSSAFMVTAGVALLSIFGKYILETLNELLHSTFTHINPSTINSDDILIILLPYGIAIAKIVFPFLFILAITGFFLVRMQVGAIFAIDKVKFDLSNISPSKILGSAKKMLNPAEPKNLVEFVKSLIKLVVVFACGFAVLNGRQVELYDLFGVNINVAFATLTSILSQMLINMCLAMIVIGIIDKKFQDHQYEKSIKMTKQEVKDEYKDIDGDPKIKAKIRAIQMKMAQQRMMSKIPNASVVVTNPTHYAIAIEYDRLKTPAPVVVAKGVDFVAFKIREVAQHNNVPIVENPPLARALYKLVPIDGIIPSDMFVAVAEVLAYVYNKNKGG